MRTHGWSGATPASDDEAIDRILQVAGEAVDASGSDIRIADIARTLGVTRQTVYRYFPGTDALLVATAMRAAEAFLDRLALHMRGITDPGGAVVEAFAYTAEQLPLDRRVIVVLAPGPRGSQTVTITSGVAIGFAREILGRFDVDWAAHGLDEAELDELAEFMLRLLQSLIIDPGDPARTGAELRGFLSRWVAPALPARGERLPAATAGASTDQAAP